MANIAAQMNELREASQPAAAALFLPFIVLTYVHLTEEEEKNLRVILSFRKQAHTMTCLLASKGQSLARSLNYVASKYLIWRGAE